MPGLLYRTLIGEEGRAQDPAVRQRCGELAGLAGIVLNLLLCAGKLVAGVLSASVSMTADALNNLSDAASALVTLVGFRIAGRKPDRDHPFGHGRAEYLAGLAVSALILVVGLELAKSAVEKLLAPQPLHFSLLSALILGLAVCVKLGMFWFYRRVGRWIDSAAMAATATDSLTDAAATAMVLAAAVIERFFGLRVDGWAGLVVSLFILRAGWGAVKETLDPLLGQRPDPALVRAIERAVLAHDMVVGVHDLIIHDYGPGRRMMTLHVEVPHTGDLMVMHDEIDRIERELRENFRIETCIHMDPVATDDEAITAMRVRTVALVRGIDPALTIHDFRMTAGPRHQNLIFDVVIPYGFRLTDEETVRAITRAVAALEDGTYYAVIEVDHSAAGE